MAYQPQFTITPSLLSQVEAIAVAATIKRHLIVLNGKA